ncbi:MAG TPA: methyltransferase [Caulobacteraceae bacterium]
MSNWKPLATGVLLAALSGLSASASIMIPENIARAVENPDRPAADRERDSDRKPSEVLKFADVRTGQTVVDFMPGRGYFTKMFSVAVGPKGKVYAYIPTEVAQFSKTPLPANGSTPDPKYPNVTALVGPVADFSTPTRVDLVWTSQNYHDLHDPFMGPVDMLKFDRAIYKALKPGGEFVIEDHAAVPGSGVTATNTLHRIDPAVVKQEVEAAGFVFDGESAVLRNSADPHTAKVFDPAIRGHTDQFVYKFRKPR